MKKYLALMLVVLMIVAMLPAHGLADDTPEDVELWNALNPLNTTVTFLNIGAHPDDERSDFLAYLSRGLGVKTASLIANRGEGGQNEIGSELGDGLGIIRSNEMKEAAKVTGVKAYHLSETTSDPIYDFGFSKSPEETLEKWGEELTYERLIRFIRTYQPDIVMPSFQNVDTQHGHHRAMTLLSGRAFEDAADPSVFPEQLKEGLSVWQVKKLYLPVASKNQATTTIDIGRYDPIYGMSYPQLGEESRYLHKSQGMGKDIPVEPRPYHLKRWKEASSSEEEGLFSSIPYDLSEWAEQVPEKKLRSELKKIQQQLDHIVDLYPDRNAILSPSKQALKDVRKMLERIGKSALDQEVKNTLVHKLTLKEEQLQEVSFLASGLTLDTKISSATVTRGDDVSLSMTVKNNGENILRNIDVSLQAPADWEFDGQIKISQLKPNQEKTVTFTGKVPLNQAYTHPYDDALLMPSVQFTRKGITTTSTTELPQPLYVLPKLAVSTSPENLIVNTVDIKDSMPVRVRVKNYGTEVNVADVALQLPEGWESEPKQEEIKLSPASETEVSFKVSPPSHITSGTFAVKAMAESKNEVFNTSVQEIVYEHIDDAYYQYPATIEGVAFELQKPDTLKIGYVESGFDQVADALLNAGFDVTKLTEQHLASADLGQYDTIVTGIRARLSREDLVRHNERLLEYVEDGGHLVVQYHKPWDQWDQETTAPYPLEIGQPSIEWRVTDENAPVTVTKPEHPLFNYPNNIDSSDWNNWVQERGLYFPMSWDDRFETFVSMADPNEDPFTGGILMAEYGEGTYLYTNLVFYRQIANQVPGGYRLFTNLLSYGTIK
ncbi:hypothetical protein G4V62_11015 [Bacillaceae bacterium SIJ1]|uniref:NEW3 domain-containing protein n=1 Tax=Litoribacterium kuwaitense TaxID=1398745 RepID=UPI0013EBC9AA|nr:NEW3 domain-containing protein [Litoribacterium kuwaitense]NGP45462.1 hypothetical protein [Litoribacterium kuwaitense]